MRYAHRGWGGGDREKEEEDTRGNLAASSGEKGDVNQQRDRKWGCSHERARGGCAENKQEASPLPPMFFFNSNLIAAGISTTGCRLDPSLEGGESARSRPFASFLRAGDPSRRETLAVVWIAQKTHTHNIRV